MKNILKLSLAAIAIAALSACGGGDSSDAADSYTGNWKSNCYKFTATNGSSYYGQQLLTFSKASASELAGNYSKGVAYTDAGCTNVAGNLDTGPAFKVNIGAETTFLGAVAKAMVYTFADGQARQGFITADATKMNFVITDATGVRPGGWGASSPYTKQ